MNWPKDNAKACIDFYGAVGTNQVQVTLPYTMKLTWDASSKISKFACHKLVANPIREIFEDVLSFYGLDGIRSLKLDLFSGCLNVRKKRGGTSWSTHSWGIAVDMDDEDNQLKWGRDRALFAKKEYIPFWDIVYKHGAISLGRERNFDWQHFQFATL